MHFQPDRRPSKWGATAAMVPNQTAEAVVEYLSTARGTPFDGVIRLSEITAIKGYRYCLLQVSLDFGHPHFPAIAETLDEVGGSEFQLIVVETPERAVYLIVDRNNLPEEEARPDHPVLCQIADWLGPAMALPASGDNTTAESDQRGVAPVIENHDALREQALRLHAEKRGKVAVAAKVPLETQLDLSLAYSPGVAEPCRKIAEMKDDVYQYTSKGNLVAVVSDGSAVLGLGNIGPEAGLPVMEGKALLFKAFAGVDSFPLVLASQDVDQIVQTVKMVAPTFGGINLEDISAPRCFEIERRLKEELDIPVFHDDQHGTAVVVAAGVLNALRVVGKQIDEVRVVVEGAGASGMAVANLLLDMGVRDLTMVDTKGTIYEGRTVGMNPYKEEIARRTNPRRVIGGLADALRDADIFIGLSAAGTTTREMVASMRPSPIVFACSNPDPEIWPEDAKAAGAAVVATGRSDYPNQLNNVLAFPGIFRGALDVRARTINEAMKLAAARAIAELVPEDQLSADYIIPTPFDRRVAPAVASAVARAAMETGVARHPMTPEQVAEHCRTLIAGS